MRKFPALLVALLTLFGCSESAQEPTPVVETTPAQVEAFDLEGWMNTMATVLQNRCDLYQAALNDPAAFTRAQADLASNSYYEELHLVGLLWDHLDAHKDWTPSICGWYDSVLRSVEDRFLFLSGQMRDHDAFDQDAATRIYNLNDADEDPGSRRKVHQTIMYFGYARFKKDHPDRLNPNFSDVADLYILCVKLRYIEE
jgi:hypothetical protein